MLSLHSVTVLDTLVFESIEFSRNTDSEVLHFATFRRYFEQAEVKTFS